MRKFFLVLFLSAFMYKGFSAASTPPSIRLTGTTNSSASDSLESRNIPKDKTCNCTKDSPPEKKKTKHRKIVFIFV